MNPTRSLDSFETRLLAELRQQVAERAEAPTPLAPERRRGRLAAVAAAAAVVGMAGVALVARPAPANAVQKLADGSLVVTIGSPADVGPLQAALVAAGVDAAVAYVGPARAGVQVSTGADGIATVTPIGPDALNATNPSGYVPPTLAPSEQAQLEANMERVRQACAFGDPSQPPVTMTEAGAGFVVRLDARWVSAREHLALSTISASSEGAAQLFVTYSVPGGMCQL